MRPDLLRPGRLAASAVALPSAARPRGASHGERGQARDETQAPPSEQHEACEAGLLSFEAENRRRERRCPSGSGRPSRGSRARPSRSSDRRANGATLSDATRPSAAPRLPSRHRRGPRTHSTSFRHRERQPPVPEAPARRPFRSQIACLSGALIGWVAYAGLAGGSVAAGHRQGRTRWHRRPVE